MPDELDQATLVEYGRMAVKLAQNKKTRRAFIKAVKEIEPDRMFPDQDIADLREEMEAKRETDKIERETARALAEQAAQRNGLIASGRFTVEQVKDMEKTVMEVHGIHNYDVAAIVYGADKAPARSSSRSPTPDTGPWQLPKLEGLLEDPARAARQQAMAEIDAINSARR